MNEWGTGMWESNEGKREGTGKTRGLLVDCIEI